MLAEAVESGSGLLASVQFFHVALASTSSGSHFKPVKREKVFLLQEEEEELLPLFRRSFSFSGRFANSFPDSKNVKCSLTFQCFPVSRLILAKLRPGACGLGITVIPLNAADGLQVTVQLRRPDVVAVTTEHTPGSDSFLPAEPRRQRKGPPQPLSRRLYMPPRRSCRVTAPL